MWINIVCLFLLSTSLTNVHCAHYLDFPIMKIIDWMIVIRIVCDLITFPSLTTKNVIFSVTRIQLIYRRQYREEVNQCTSVNFMSWHAEIRHLLQFTVRQRRHRTDISVDVYLLNFSLGIQFAIDFFHSHPFTIALRQALNNILSTEVVLNAIKRVKWVIALTYRQRENYHNAFYGLRSHLTCLHQMHSVYYASDDFAVHIYFEQQTCFLYSLQSLFHAFIRHIYQSSLPFSFQCSLFDFNLYDIF